MYECVSELGHLHCFLNGLITFHVREVVTGKGEVFHREGWFWICLEVWSVDSKVLFPAEMSRSSAEERDEIVMMS